MPSKYKMHSRTCRVKRILKAEGVSYSRIYNDTHRRSRTIKFFGLNCNFDKAISLLARIYTKGNDARTTSGYPYTSSISISITVPL